MWRALEVSEKPVTSAYTVAPRARACSSSSRTTMPQPSPRTNPSRSASNGRDAASGRSLCRLDRQRMTSKAAIVMGEIGASLAPVSMTSTSPSRTASNAYPTASTPPTQPVETVAQGPRAPSSEPRMIPGVFDIAAR